MIARVTAIAVAFCCLLGVSAASAQRGAPAQVKPAAPSAKEWFEVYDEAIRHIQKREWGPAETKLQQAKAGGPRPAASVRRYGMQYRPFFPDFYLGIVYVETNRIREAEQQFRLARAQGLDAKAKEFQRIADYEQRVTDELSRMAKAEPPREAERPPGKPAEPIVDPKTEPPPPPPNPTVEPETPKVTDVPKNAGGDSSPTPVTPAPGPSAAPSDGTLLNQLSRDVERALARRDITSGRAALQRLVAAGGDAVTVKQFQDRVSALDLENQRAGATERVAMRAFFSGAYEDAIQVLRDIESKGGRLTLRGSLYRACSLAALAIRGDKVDAAALAEARKYYAQLSGAPPPGLAPDLRFVSPRILAALKP